MTDLVAAEGPRLDRVLADTYPLWHDGLSRAAYARYYEAQRLTAWGRRHLQRFALVDGHEVLASAKLYHLAGTLDGREIRLAGIGAVFTTEPHRGRGCARELLERLLERERANGVDLALLFSEIPPEYYRRLGFEPVPASELVLRVVTPEGRGAPAVLVRAGEDRDLAAIAESFAVRAAGYRFHLNRDRDLVQFAIARKRLLAGLGPPDARRTLFFIAEEGGRAVAYVLMTEHAGDWILEECGDRDPAAARIGAILQVLLAREPGQRRPLVRGWLPPGIVPPQVAIVGRAPAREVMMIRPLATGAPSPPLAEDDVLYCRSDYF